MTKTFYMAALFALFIYGSAGVERAEASAADGTWLIHDLALNIYDCGNLVCGKIVWIGDPKKRTPGKCGKVIVWGLARSGPSEWSGGHIYDTEKDATYNLSAELTPRDTLNARIYKGIPLFGKTEILTRIQPRSRPDWC
jgi:uncharacterized protein (DUF2147 family)